MKKLIVLLLALSVVGIAVMAQDAAAAPAPTLKFSGYFNIGPEYYQLNGGAQEWYSNGSDSSTQGRFNLNAKYDAGSYGVAFRLREQDQWGIGNSGEVFARRLYGWMDAFNGMVRFQAGRLGDYAWSTGSGGNSWNCFGNLDGFTGMQVQIKPIDGLNFGGFVPFNSTASGAFAKVNSSGVPVNASAVSNPGDIVDAFSQGMIAGAYYLKDVGDIELGYMPGMFKDTGMFFFGAAYTGMSNLTAMVEGIMDNIGDTGTGGYAFTYLWINAAYKMDALTVGVIAEPQIYSWSDLGTKLRINPSVSYTIGDVAPGLGFVYLSDGIKGGPYTGWEVDPNVKFTLGKDTTLNVWAGFGGGKVLDPGQGFSDPKNSSAQDVYNYFMSRDGDVGYTPYYALWAKAGTVTKAGIDFVWNF